MAMEETATQGTRWGEETEAIRKTGILSSHQDQKQVIERLSILVGRLQKELSHVLRDSEPEGASAMLKSVERPSEVRGLIESATDELRTISDSIESILNRIDL